VGTQTTKAQTLLLYFDLLRRVELLNSKSYNQLYGVLKCQDVVDLLQAFDYIDLRLSGYWFA